MIKALAAVYVVGMWIAYAFIRLSLSDPWFDDDMPWCWVLAIMWPVLIPVGIFIGIGKLTDRLLIRIMDKRNKGRLDRE